MNHKNSHTTCLFLCITVYLLSVFFRPDKVQAQTIGGSFEVEPAFQELAITDDQASVSSSLTLTNHSEVTQLFELYAVEIKQFDSSGRVVLVDKPLSGTDYSFADFIHTEKNNWTVLAGETAHIPFTVKNAPKLSPGGHYAALIARLKENPSAPQQVLPAVSAFILVRKVGGELYHLSFVDFNRSVPNIWWSAHRTLHFTMSNQGNIHVVPRGTVKLKTLWGSLAYKGVLNENSLYLFPGTQRPIQAELHRVSWYWPVMIYNLVVDARSEPGNILAHQEKIILIINPIASFIFIFPPILMIIISSIKKRSRVKNEQ